MLDLAESPPQPARAIVEALAALSHDRLICIEGLERIEPGCDPFILALNHQTRREALLVPACLIRARSGRLIHFLSDWNFRLIPGLGAMLRATGTIPVMRKPARPRFLTRVRPLFGRPLPPMEEARGLVLGGRSIGLFPEGEVNRHPSVLLRGRHGAARLSLETGVPIIPGGIRLLPSAGVLPATLDVQIGRPLWPPVSPTPASLADVRDWHAAMMTRIAALSGKRWRPSYEQATGDLP